MFMTDAHPHTNPLLAAPLIDQKPENLPEVIASLVNPEIPLPPGVEFFSLIPSEYQGLYTVAGMAFLGVFAFMMAAAYSTFSWALIAVATPVGLAGLWALSVASRRKAQARAERDAASALHEEGKWRVGIILSDEGFLEHIGGLLTYIPRSFVQGFEYIPRRHNGKHTYGERFLIYYGPDPDSKSVLNLHGAQSKDLKRFEFWIENGMCQIEDDLSE